MREQCVPDPVDVFYREAAGKRGWHARQNARVAALAHAFQIGLFHPDDPAFPVSKPPVQPWPVDRFRRWWHAPVEKVLRWLRLL